MFGGVDRQERHHSNVSTEYQRGQLELPKASSQDER